MSPTRKVRITVLDIQFNPQLAKEYGAAGMCKCDRFFVGQQFITGGHKPKGFCEEAWCPMMKYVFAMCHGVTHFWSDWIEKDNVCIVSCVDGLRPVIFKLEAFTPEDEKENQ